MNIYYASILVYVSKYLNYHYSIYNLGLFSILIRFEMAFVFKAERPHVTLATETAKLTNIGPGSYGKL